MSSIISIRNLTKTFGSGEGAVTALDDVSLDVEEGEIFGVIGLSGAGKSTLVRCVNLLERPTAGTVTVCGQELTALSEKELRLARRQIGMIFQSFNLLMQKNALQNVCFPLVLAGTPKKEAEKRARELLDIVGLADREKAYPAQLSGGQKQRVAIARALSTSPRVLLCDEATSALDPETTLSILELLRDLNRSLGVTVVAVTHEMKVIEKLCSRVAVIADSRIAECGPVDEVFRSPKTEAGRRLVLPDGGSMKKFAGGGKLIRLTFGGETTDRPVIADMILKFSAPVNIVYADTKSVDGRLYGHTIIQLPADGALADAMLAYLRSERIGYSEEAAQ